MSTGAYELIKALFISALLCTTTAFAQSPNGLQYEWGKTDGAAAAYYYAAKCGDKLALWVGLDNGHIIQYDAQHMPENDNWGALLKKLEGLPNSVVDLCPSSKL